MKSHPASIVSFIVSVDSKLGESIKTSLLQIGIDCSPKLLSLEDFQSLVVSSDNTSKLFFIDIRDRTDQAVALFRKRKHQASSNYIAIGDSTNPYEVIEILKGGADDFLDSSENLHFQTVNAIKRFQSRSVNQDSGHGSMTIVTGASGGCGASIVAQNFAVIAGQGPRSCGLLDYDLRKGDQSSLLNLRPIHTIADLCVSFDVVDKKMVEQSFATHESGVRLLASPETSTNAGHIQPKMLLRIAELASEVFEQIVIDLPTAHLNDFSNLLSQCDRLVIVFRTDFSSIKNAVRQLESLKSMGFSLEKLDLVANRWGSGATIDIDEIQNAIGQEIHYEIREDAKVFHCVNCGKPVVTEWPSSDVAKVIRRIHTRNLSANEQNVHGGHGGWLSTVFSKYCSQRGTTRRFESEVASRSS